MVKRVLNFDAVEFKRVIEDTDTYGEAAAILGCHIKTVCVWAAKLGIAKKDGKDISRELIPLQYILDGNHPHYPTFLLKKRLLKEGLLSNRCSGCKITEWNQKSIVLELDHTDGDRTNHALQNLRLLCPNCHSQTKTYKSKNKKLKRQAAE